MVFCVSVWYGKYENLLQFNSLASLRTWSSFRFCFSFSYSGWDLKLIMKRHALNCYSVLLKFLLKTKTCKHVVGNRSSFTAKTTNSEKSIYFLSLMSCSTSKLKPRMSFTCQSFIFSNFTREKVFCSRKWWGWKGEGWRPPAPLPFPYGPGQLEAHYSDITQ